MNQESPYSLTRLNQELNAVIVDSSSYHKDMDNMLSFYKGSAFYPSRSGKPRTNMDLSNNLLRVFADKNVHFTSPFPVMKVPTTGATEMQRQSASIREKIILAAWRKSNGELKQKKWAKDATLLSAAIAETTFDLKNRCVVINRYDPRYCYWQLSNGNDKSVVAFWAVYPITEEECIAKYGIQPTGDTISASTLANTFLKAVDGKNWFLQATRWDDEVRASWIGDTYIEEPHEHMMGGIPIDVCMPFDDIDAKGNAAFYLEPMVNTQANLNLTIQRRDSIVERYAHPLIYGKGVVSKQLDDIKQGLKGGGFVGLKTAGDLGILQLKEISVLNDHEKALRDDMLRMSGFSAAAMGELAGANTSGDALGMYFTPTQRHIENQNISWIAFYRAINAKILRLYDRFGKTGETFNISGYAPSGTVMGINGESNKMQYSRGGFDVEFDKTVINGNYNSLIEMPAITPKNQIEEKRLIIEAVDKKFLSRTTAYEKFGIESPEDELALLQQEQSEPALNPAGMQQLVAAANSIPQLPAGAGATPNPPLPTPKAPELMNNVRQPV